MRVESIFERLFFTTVRIETPSDVGTGFVLTHKWAEDKDALFLVTNKHVVSGSTSGTLKFTRKFAGTDEPYLGGQVSITVSGKTWKWVGHPASTVDVAVFPLEPILQTLRSGGNDPYFQSLTTDDMPSRDDFSSLDAVEDVLFVGYPNGIYDQVNNLPIIRKGMTATPIFVDYEWEPIFLIDGSVFPGSSGSPVLVYKHGVWANREGTFLGSEKLFLMGILASAFFQVDDGTLTFRQIPTQLTPVVSTQQMIDLGVVFKARTILETIEILLQEQGKIPITSPWAPGPA